MRKAIYNKLLRNLATAATEIRIPVPLIGIGCGVLGLALPKVTIKMGKYASKLLRAL